MPSLHDLFPRLWNSGGRELDDFIENPWLFTRMFDVDVLESERAISIEAELPGFRKDEILVELDERSISIRASRQDDREEKDGKYFKRERQFGKVERTIALPAEVVIGSSEASYVDGVLKIKLEKKQSALPKRQTLSIH
jgi:HSP20 family protein